MVNLDFGKKHAFDDFRRRRCSWDRGCCEGSNNRWTEQDDSTEGGGEHGEIYVFIS